MTSTNLHVCIAGIGAPNPFWLASGPPTNTEGQVRRAFEAGWGGAVWKTVTNEPIVNVSSRYGGLDFVGRKLAGLNNIELISDRSLDDNLREIARIKREFPDRALLVSAMTETRREAWHELIARIEQTGADGIELNFGCPHGMSERGQGSAVGQVPEYAGRVVEWVKEVARTPVFVKLTPNVTDIRAIAHAVQRNGADAVSLINTINSIIGVDLTTLAPRPDVAGLGTHGGYCGPAIKPIALHLVSQLATDPQFALPISGIGGIAHWQDAAEHMLLGATCVQVCTAVMHRGFGIVGRLIGGLREWMDKSGFHRPADFVGRSARRVVEWSELDLNYRVVAEIDASACIDCGLCLTACEDGCYQAIGVEPIPAGEFVSSGPAATAEGRRLRVLRGDESHVNVYRVDERRCTGCNMCALVCPVANCVTMRPVETGKTPMTWRDAQRRGEPRASASA